MISQTVVTALARVAPAPALGLHLSPITRCQLLGSSHVATDRSLAAAPLSYPRLSPCFSHSSRPAAARRFHSPAAPGGPLTGAGSSKHGSPLGGRPPLPPPLSAAHPSAPLQTPPCLSAVGSGGPSDAPLQGRFMIPASEVQQLLAQTGSSVQELLLSLIQPAARLARPPVSGYHVGAAGLGASGALYVGVNLEFQGAPLNNSVHAEQFLVVNCLQHGEESIGVVAVSAAPCGHCRQFCAELVKADELLFLFGSQSKPILLEDLLPRRFGPQDLIADEPFPLLMEKRNNRVQLSAYSVAALQSRPSDLQLSHAAEAALKEANQAYSPYSRCPSGAAIITHSGRVFSGGCIESAAYNPSLSPFHTAYIAAVAGGMWDAGEIKEVLLAELPDAPVQHKHNVQLLMNKLAPEATLTFMDVVPDDESA